VPDTDGCISIVRLRSRSSSTGLSRR